MTKKHFSYDSEKAGKLVLIWTVPFSAIIIILFYFLWHNKIKFSDILNNIQDHIFIFIFLFLGSIFLHELLHAVAYLIFDKCKFKEISFGFSKHFLSPYCHYSGRVKLWKYRIALLMPGFVMGIIPIIISFSIGNFYLLIYGLIFTLGAFGDFYILYKIRKQKSSIYVKDSPNMMGCILEEN